MSQTKSGTTDQLVSEARSCAAQSSRYQTRMEADQGRADTIRELYVDDGELLVGPTPLRGREAILEWGRQLVENPPWALHPYHVCGNMRFVSDGPDAPEGTTILTVSMIAGS